MRFDLPTMEEIRGTQASTTGHGSPLLLPIEDIDEDPEQPRQEFDPTSLAQLAATIAGRGVRQPVSVRKHPSKPGRWILNFGARRLRAAKLAGESVIAAFEDVTVDAYDQVIENEQREGLKPLEIALFVKRQLDRGESQADIARGIGKSQAYVTYACSLIEPPDWLIDLYRSGRCRGMFELYELRRLHGMDAGGVAAALGGNEHFGRVELKLLKASMASGREDASAGGAGVGDPRKGSAAQPERSAASSGAGLGGPSPSTVRLAARSVKTVPLIAESSALAAAEMGLVLRGTFEGSSVRVILDALPEKPQSLFVATSDGTRRVANIADVNQLELTIDLLAQR